MISRGHALRENVYSVGQVGAYIRNMFAQDFMLKRISVKGEISNCKYHRSGHIYFTLKDEVSSIACVMFAGDRKGLTFAMKDGDRVVVTGPIEVYIRDGKYQLYAKKIELQGAGLLYERFLALKAELEELGMFDDSFKKPIPRYVKRLGIVTAPTGAAVQDIRNIALRRNPYIELILYPALVQGEGAVKSIVTGIETLDRLGLDCIIVGRGGGSIEDLWAFNEEAVARAIFNCETPVISAVGHETDTTIADFVADLRAPTPSAGAELAVANIADTLRRLDEAKARLENGMHKSLDRYEERLRSYRNRWKYLSPENQIREKRQRIADLEIRMTNRQEQILQETKNRKSDLEKRFSLDMKQQVQDRRHTLELLIRQMDGLSPIRKLNQGYSYAENDAGRNVSEIGVVKRGDAIHIQVTDGVIHTEVTGTEKRKREF